jgi:hypothetical protein
MLRAVALVDQFRQILSELPPDWPSAEFALHVAGPENAPRAAALLGPLAPGRSGATVRFGVVATGTDNVARLLRRLDREQIEGSLELEATAVPAAATELEDAPLAAAWRDELAALPADWSDLFAEVEFTSSDHLAPAALRLAPLNPLRDGERLAFRFRSARRFGYGAAEPMVRRCLERVDEAGIPGTVRILHVFSDTNPVGTQGPVWFVGGRNV